MSDSTANSAIHPIVADLLLAVHFLWALWMVMGVALALAGFRWPRLWTWRAFRIAHLIGLLGTASVPIWANGICPLTTWEWDLRSGTGSGAIAAAEPCLRHWMRQILFLDVSPLVLSVITALGAAATLAVFVRHLPRQPKRALSQTVRDPGNPE
jgi:hypothetical protein